MQLSWIFAQLGLHQLTNRLINKSSFVKKIWELNIYFYLEIILDMVVPVLSQNKNISYMFNVEHALVITGSKGSKTYNFTLTFMIYLDY